MRHFVPLPRLAAAGAAAALLLLVAAPARAGIFRYAVRVDGLACAFCAYGLEKKLKELPGVSRVTIDLDGGLASFDVAEEHTLLPGPVLEAVRHAGFSPRTVTIRASGEVAGSGDELILDVGHGHSLHLRGGDALARLREIVEGGHRDVVVTGPVTHPRDTWNLRVDAVDRREGS